jgi:hydroxyacylglutathione hydrolase
MYFRQILHPDLGCASYVVADQDEAVVVDPKWEIDEYLRAAAEADAQITHVLETHTHADHVSGRLRLAAATGATPRLPAAEQAPGLHDGDVLRVGAVEIVALATPGHRPEHLSYLVHNGSGPQLLLTGDSLLVGDVARPDLAVPAAEGARDLFQTLRRLGSLPDEVEVWPAHVGGSLCASHQASTDTTSTVGKERRENPLLAVPDVDAFSAEVTRRIPPRPPTMNRVLELNRTGARDPGPVPEVDAAGLRCLVSTGACLLDVRDPEAYDRGHVAGSINLALAGRGLGIRAGWAVCADEPIVLIAGEMDQARAAAELLRAAGLWNLAGLTEADPGAWIAAGIPVQTSRALDADGLLAAIEATTVLDVRDRTEWDTGHLPGSRSLPLAVLGDGRGELALPSPVAVICAGGIRAALAASILRRAGHPGVSRVAGGVQDLAGRGLTLVGAAA